MWTGIYDRKHEKNVQLERELALAKKDLRRQESMYRDALWTLHELSNGAGPGHTAIKLYRAGQLQERVSYEAKNRKALGCGESNGSRGCTVPISRPVSLQLCEEPPQLSRTMRFAIIKP